jgi:hypothetical protein
MNKNKIKIYNNIYLFLNPNNITTLMDSKSDTIDSDVRLMHIVKELYKSGSDNRQQKNGSSDKLYEGIRTSGHGIKTCGLDAMLPRYLKVFVDTKRFPNEVDYKGKTMDDGHREIAKIINDIYKSNRKDIYISMTEVGKQTLYRILSGDNLSSADYRKSFNLFGKFGVIAQQEKSKNRPGKQKYK